MKKIFTILAALLVCATSFAIYLDAPTYSIEGQDLKISGTANGGEVVAVTLYGWMEIGFDTKGAYGVSSLRGTINGVNVENTKETVSIYQDGFVAYLSAQLEDADGNEYQLEAGLLNLTSDVVKPGDTIHVVANDMTITQQTDRLRLRATENGTGKKIDLQLVQGKNATGVNMFGDYGYPNNDTTAFANVENARYDGYNVMLELNKTYNKADYYQEGDMTIFEGVFDDQDSKDVYFLYLSTPVEIHFDSFKEEPLFTPADTTVSRRTGETIITPANWLVLLEHDTYRFSFNYYSEHLTGTYSWEEGDFLQDFTWGYDKQVVPYAEKINFKSCVLTITESKPTATVTRYTLDATIVATNDVRYLVHATHDVLTATEVVEAEILDAQINPTDYGFVLVAKDEALELDINLSIRWAYGMTGYFGNYHVDSVNTAITHKGQTFIPSELEMEVVYGVLSSGKQGYVIPAMQFMSPDVVAYNLKIEAPIVPTDTVDITCTNLLWDPSQATEETIMFEASNGAYAISGVYRAAKISVGTYQGENVTIYLTEIASDKTIEMYETTLTVGGNALKGYTAEIEALGKDHKAYQLHLSKQADPTALHEVQQPENASKVIKNGQLIIIKNGIPYNAQGAIVR